MGEHIYIEESLAADGYLEQLKALPTRQVGESAADWQERCDAKIEAWLSVGHIDRDFAERSIGCSEYLAAELKRTPSMVGWCHREYFVSVINRLDPSDNSSRFRLASDCEFPDDGEDGFVERMLLGLMS